MTADLRSADEAFEKAKTHYENLVAALKEARKKLQGERDDALADIEAGINERDALRRERADEIQRHRKLLADREAVSLDNTPVYFLELMTGSRPMQGFKAIWMPPEIVSPKGTRTSRPSSLIYVVLKTSGASWGMNILRIGSAWNWR